MIKVAIIVVFSTWLTAAVFPSFRWAGPDSVLPPDAGPAATSDQETAAGGRCCSCSPTESRTATAGTGNSSAKGEALV